MSVMNVMISVTYAMKVKTFGFTFRVLYPSRGSFKIFWENGLVAFVTEKLVVISSLYRISMFFTIIILQVSELID